MNVRVSNSRNLSEGSIEPGTRSPRLVGRVLNCQVHVGGFCLFGTLQNCLASVSISLGLYTQWMYSTSIDLGTAHQVPPPPPPPWRVGFWAGPVRSGTFPYNVGAGARSFSSSPFFSRASRCFLAKHALWEVYLTERTDRPSAKQCRHASCSGENMRQQILRAISKSFGQAGFATERPTVSKNSWNSAKHGKHLERNLFPSAIRGDERARVGYFIALHLTRDEVRPLARYR